MIDTIVFNIPGHMFRVIRPELFYPNAENVLDTRKFWGRPLVKAVQNPSKKDIAEGNYKPRLTLLNRLVEGGRQLLLKVELSLPKLIFGNNFDELENADFDVVLERLVLKLREMGVAISIEDLPNVSVSVVHYSKNIILDDYASVSMIIKELAKVDLTQRLDLARTNFRNEGHSLCYHANSFELIFYDKIKDLEQAEVSEKRAVENDNRGQLSIFDFLKKQRPLEVLRMEVRLGKRQKIKQIFSKIGFKGEINFRNVFDSQISQKVLQLFWADFDKGLKFFTVEADNPADLLVSLQKVAPNLKPAKQLMIIGAIVSIQQLGFRGLRERLGMVKTKSYMWYRLKKDLEIVDEFRVGDKYRAILKIPAALRSFASLRLDNMVKFK